MPAVPFEADAARPHRIPTPRSSSAPTTTRARRRAIARVAWVEEA
jgi:hypothetical protein